MRVEPFTTGDYVHIYNRGNRKSEIVRSDEDAWRFMQSLRFFNDSHSSVNLLRQISMLKSDFNRRLSRPAKSVFETGWPPDWPEKDPLVKILCYCLMPNHFHLLLNEIREGGISKFMQKIGVGYTNYFNLKYQEVGRLFQSAYRGKTIKNEQSYLEYLTVYIQVINTLELFPGRIEKALENIDEGLKFVEKYQFSSYQDFIGLRRSLIIDKDVLGEIFPNSESYKEFARAIIENKKCEIIEDLELED